jgi:hypothetical protein
LVEEGATNVAPVITPTASTVKTNPIIAQRRAGASPILLILRIAGRSAPSPIPRNTIAITKPVMIKLSQALPKRLAKPSFS